MGARIVVLLNLLLVVAIGAGGIWLGHRLFDSWWSLVVTIPVALALLGSWARWKLVNWDLPRAEAERSAHMQAEADRDLVESLLNRPTYAGPDATKE